MLLHTASALKKVVNSSCEEEKRNVTAIPGEAPYLREGQGRSLAGEARLPGFLPFPPRILWK